LVVYGGLPKTEEDDSNVSRELHIKLFKNDPTRRILIANPPACGESISLHNVCHDAIYFDRTFNCGQYLQSLDRIHRIGLKKSEAPNYYILINKDSIDETIDERLAIKQESMERVINEELPILDMEFNGLDTELDVKDVIAVEQHLKKVVKNGL
jgi:SNF2 family DNA or RNA helicase